MWRRGVTAFGEAADEGIERVERLFGHGLVAATSPICS